MEYPETISKTDYRMFLIGVKYLPVVGSLLSFLHVIHSLFIGTGGVLEVTFGVSFSLVLTIYLAQRAFKFCMVHRLLSWYCVLADLLLSLKIRPLLYVCALLGIMLFIVLTVKIMRNEYTVKSVERPTVANNY